MSWTVVFKGARDSYQVPLALHEVGKLSTLVTDWYSPFDHEWFPRLAAVGPAGLRGSLRRRYCPGLPSSRVVSVWWELLRSKASSYWGSRVGDDRIGALAGQLARRHGGGILAYSYYGYSAFRGYGAGPLPKILFQLHPHPLTVRRILEEEVGTNPGCWASLSRELEMAMPQHRLQQLAEEPLLADLCIVASGYTRDTLIENGCDPNKIHVVPYGVDSVRFSPPERPPVGPLRVLFVGQIVQRKGLMYLLEAWRRLSLHDSSLIVAGRGEVDPAVLAALSECEGSVELRRNVSSSELHQLYRTSHVCCVPSLAEGFGLVYLESLACGTPVIATSHTGAADIINQGQEGFIVQPRNSEELTACLAWCYDHPDELAAMRMPARHLAESYSWSRFRRGVVQVVADAEVA